MTHNIGTIDRILRVMIGLALLAWAAFGSAEVRWLGLIGLVPLLTAALSNCPLYTLLGLHTCSRPRKA